jgi:hypothetical protein
MEIILEAVIFECVFRYSPSKIAGVVAKMVVDIIVDIVVAIILAGIVATNTFTTGKLVVSISIVVVTVATPTTSTAVTISCSQNCRGKIALVSTNLLLLNDLPTNIHTLWTIHQDPTRIIRLAHSPHAWLISPTILTLELVEATQVMLAECRAIAYTREGCHVLLRASFA